tara:strand:- start:6828 stop:7121 length:294 start_codon:yes stop_codon:yes gene_type:complete
MISTTLVNPQAAAALPWAEILGGGAAGVAVFMCYLFLRHMSEARKEANVVIEKVSTDFASTVRDNSEKFSETTQFILTDSKDREAKLHELLRGRDQT